MAPAGSGARRAGGRVPAAGDSDRERSVARDAPAGARPASAGADARADRRAGRRLRDRRGHRLPHPRAHAADQTGRHVALFAGLGRRRDRRVPYGSLAADAALLRDAAVDDARERRGRARVPERTGHAMAGDAARLAHLARRRSPLRRDRPGRPCRRRLARHGRATPNLVGRRRAAQTRVAARAGHDRCAEATDGGAPRCIERPVVRGERYTTPAASVRRRGSGRSSGRSRK